MPNKKTPTVPQRLQATLVEEARAILTDTEPVIPGPSDFLSPRAAQKKGTINLSDYIDYLDSRHTKRATNGWIQENIILAHLIDIGPISQLEAAFVYGIIRLSAITGAFNKKQKQPPYMATIRRGRQGYGIVFLSNEKPSSGTGKASRGKN